MLAGPGARAQRRLPLLTGIFNRDFDIVQSVTLIYALLVVLINLGADLAYAALDPRVVLGK